MSFKQRLQDYFYDRVYDAAGSHYGRKALTLMSPVFARACPPEKVTQSPEEVLRELGYQPEAFQEITQKKVRVFKRDLSSMLSLCSMLSDKGLIERAFSKHMDAVAFFPNNEDASVRYLLLNYDREYDDLMGNLSSIPEKFLTGIKGDPNLAQALTLGHEMAHFELPSTNEALPAQMVSIESSCDFWPAYFFRKAAEPTIFQDTYNDLMHARAVGPILVYMKDKLDKDKSVFGHATALCLAHPELFDDPNMGDTIIEAYSEACEILQDYIDWESFEPRIFQCYKAAKQALEQEDFDNIWAHRALEMFANGMDYLAPELVEQIMTPPKQRNALVLDAA